MFETSAIHVPQHLADLCVAYDPKTDGYIRGIFFPRKDVSNETDLVASVSTADILRLYDLDISGRAEMKEVTFRTSADIQYRCKGIAAKAEINPKDVKNADAAYRFEKRQTKTALTSCGIRMEHLAVNGTIRSTTAIPNFVTLTGPTQWDAFGSPDSDPIGDLMSAVRRVRIKTGTAAGARSRDGSGLVKIAMHEYSWGAMQQNANVRLYISASFGGAGTRVLTKKILAELLDIQEDDILITSSRHTSSQEGATTDAFASFIGPDVFVGMVDSDMENDQSLGHEFCFDGLAGEDPFLVTKWREFGKGVYQATDYVGVSCMTDYKVTNPLAGFLIQNVIDSTNALYGGEVS